MRGGGEDAGWGQAGARAGSRGTPRTTRGVLTPQLSQPRLACLGLGTGALGFIKYQHVKN